MTTDQGLAVKPVRVAVQFSDPHSLVALSACINRQMAREPRYLERLRRTLVAELERAFLEAADEANRDA